ncbi:MAG: hypothetical protein IH623_26050 [Verrucomicrobia bacterium]|nr:hypothetical protein [Verrucomicrobiota bacterium]
MKIWQIPSSGRQVLYALTAILGLAVPSYGALTYNLATDFSTVDNPNDVWSYNYGSTPITAMLTTSYAEGWSMRTDAGNSILKTTVTGDGANNWQKGDVIMHSSNVGDPNLVAVTWESPDAGTISIDGQAWGASIVSGREVKWTLTVNSTVIAGRDGLSGLVRDHADALFSNNLVGGQSLSGINVQMGDIVKFTVFSDTTTGSFAGVQQEITFTPIPEPTTLIAGALLGIPFSIAAVRRLRQRRHGVGEA